MNYQVKVIQPCGNFDGRKGRQVYEEMTRAIALGTKTILIDFQDITFMDSSGFGTMLLALRIVRQKQGRLVICSINEQIRMIFEISDTIKLFEFFPDQESFLLGVNQY
ncbi:STAS domain-containing protein [Aetokthonos hydrillicola Thurmond2011]|jgi:anti-anti-sigma factor|uniref:Anti-sigma factor antagonist n=1 Tax=Aetokthonos hydrillicola Thurmond2011 TaxID=2712845 RepID=A0AAP5ID23_9CYAN|nr:STAS domain-containing protein [Aetokthonos hydrillicola]MBO3463086.1 STAS domain-containing protein [Aetokthonos hydrillicola CCALA 1050]MBW4587033.1 STAS domain-containing protein [Aetokthonos hydrillicola CCALA 1050]MDR9897493.1 STAS domain-containing protein [Aetokthonos hydrillicola Thurmond2011]